MRSTAQLLMLAPALVACGADPAPADAGAAPAPPPDAVVQLGPGEYLSEPVYIRAAEIDRWVETISMLEPDETRRSWRRKALTNINLPIAVCAALWPQERTAARERSHALREELVAGRPLALGGPMVERLTGHARELGLVRWGRARELPQDEWSEVIEEAGTFYVLRRVSPDPGRWTPATPIAIEQVEVRFVDAAEAASMVDDARPKLGVRPLNPPGWDGILPEFYVYE